jgi:hypothetical protein
MYNHVIFVAVLFQMSFFVVIHKFSLKNEIPSNCFIDKSYRICDGLQPPCKWCERK